MRSTDMRFVLCMVLCIVLCAIAASCGSSPSNAEQVPLTLSESPISDLLGIDIALRSGDVAQLEQQAELGVVDCMKQLGFEYVAVDFASQLTEETGPADSDSREYAQTNGYGISIQPDFGSLNNDELVNPNETILQSLSEAERESYRQALYGDAPPTDEPASLSNGTGCVAESYRVVSEAQAELGNVEQFFGRFAAELAELEDRFMSDPRFVELEADWASCMADRGYPVATRGDIFVELNVRMSEVGPVPVGEEPPPELQAEMDAVSNWEREAAVADWDCTQPVQDEMRSLRYGYEALFLEENLLEENGEVLTTAQNGD